MHVQLVCLVEFVFLLIKGGFMAKQKIAKRVRLMCGNSPFRLGHLAASLFVLMQQSPKKRNLSPAKNFNAT